MEVLEVNFTCSHRNNKKSTYEKCYARNTQMTFIKRQINLSKKEDQLLII